MTIGERIKRYDAFTRLRKTGATLQEIGEMFGITRQAVEQVLKRPRPKRDPRGVLAKNGFGQLKGRERARMMVRIRDDFTCQDCGMTRTPDEVASANSNKPTAKGRIKLFDVHHTRGDCGQNSTGYDSTTDLSGMVTLCHKCHFNRPEHRAHSKEFAKAMSRATKGVSRRGNAKCKRRDCGERHKARGLCATHYRQDFLKRRAQTP